MRDDWSEEIPSEILHSVSQQGRDSNKFKVRKAWFQGVSSWLYEGIRRSYLPPEFGGRYEEFHKRVEETKFHSRDTTKEDIDYADRILDDILVTLE